MKAELEHNNITTLEEANKYLNEIFIPKMNDRFSFDINPNKNLMRENKYTLEELNIIISIRAKRTIDNASSIKYFNEYYLPIDKDTGEVISFSKGTECIVVNSYNKRLYGLINDSLYLLTGIEKPKPIGYEKVKEKKYTGHKPSDNHPWKKNMMLR